MPVANSSAHRWRVVLITDRLVYPGRVRVLIVPEMCMPNRPAAISVSLQSATGPTIRPYEDL